MHANESQPALKRVAKKVSRLFLYGTAGIILSHGALQFNNMVNKYMNLAYPSQERAAFRKTFHFPIEGHITDIEKNKYTIPVVSSVIHKELMERPLSLSSLYIRPESYFKKTFVDQVSYLLRDKASGLYNPIHDYILLDAKNFRPLNRDEDSPKDTYNTLIARLNTHHEIKHDKTEDLLLAKEPILKVWDLLAQDNAGKSLYIGELAVAQKRDLRQEDECLGFVSTYARKNVNEDIAETCSRAECVEDFLFLDQFITWIYDKPQPIISRKVKLAQQYRLIPGEFTEYVGLLKQYRDLQQNDLSSLLTYVLDSFLDRFVAPEAANPHNPLRFLSDSDIFFEKHPLSVYTIALRQRRGDLFYQHAKVRMVQTLFFKAQQEYKKGLAAQYKEPHAYQEILKNLAECSDALKENTQAQQYRDALKEYERRMYEVKDPNIALKGVEDILAK